MRVLFSAVPGYGHLHPLLPLASALANAGHDVAIATGPDLRPRAEAAGFVAFDAGLTLFQAFQHLARRFPDGRYNQLPVQEILGFYVPHLFGEILTPATLADLEPLVERWAPDLLIHDTYEFAAPLAAADAGLPSLSHTLGLHFNKPVLEATAAAVAPLWQARGLAPDATAGTYRDLCLDIAPPSLQSRTQLPGCVRPLRPVAQPPVASERLPEWMKQENRRDVPLIYMTLGTNTNTNISVFRAVTDALAERDVDLLITLGFGTDVASIGPLPSNAHVENFVPQSLVMPLCSAVICHGGAGTTLAAAAAGLPLLLMPQGADQYVLTELVVRAGAAVCLPPPAVNARNIRQAVLSLLNEPAYRAAARSLQTEMAAMPPPEAVVPEIETVVQSARASRRFAQPVVSGTA